MIFRAGCITVLCEPRLWLGFRQLRLLKIEAWAVNAAWGQLGLGSGLGRGLGDSSWNKKHVFIYFAHKAYIENAISRPQYLRGHDQFPEREPTFHPRNVLDLYRHDRLAGAFDDELFQHKWTEPSQVIDDWMITQLAPEYHYPGIQYAVTVHSRVWNPALRRGDHIILKGIDLPDIKYIATWTLNNFHNDQCVYVQFNALDIHQQCIDTTNPDWPTLGFLVLKDQCYVPTAPLPKPVQFSSDNNGNVLQSSPTLSASSLTPLIRQCHDNGESPLWKRLRHYASFNILDCRKASTMDNFEMDIKG